MNLIDENAQEYMDYKGWKGKTGLVKLVFRQLRVHLLMRLGRILPHSSLRRKCFQLMGVRIGNNVFIGLNVMMDPLYPEYISIHDASEIGDNASIYTHSRGSIPLKRIYPRKIQSVVIGKGVWIGAPNVVILPGVHIGDYSVVAASAVVTRNVPRYTVVAGIPAKKIKDIDPTQVDEI